MASNVTQVTNALVSKVVESSPQLYVNSKLHNTPNYLDASPELVNRYNQRIHSAIQMAPAEVNDYNAEVVC